LDGQRPSSTPRGPQGSAGGEVGVGVGDEEDPGLGVENGGSTHSPLTTPSGQSGVGDGVSDGESEGGVISVVNGRSGVPLTAGEDVGRIQLPRRSKPSAQLSEGGVDEELSGLVVEGVDVSVVGDGDGEELPGLVVGRIQLPRRSKPSGQLLEGGVDDAGGGEELPGPVVEGVDVGVSVVDDGDDEELPGLVVVGRRQLPRRSTPSGQLAGLEEGGILVDGGELVGDVSDDGEVVVAEGLVDGGSVFVGSVEGLVVGGDVASDGVADVELGPGVEAPGAPPRSVKRPGMSS
jgi:hypothetical protein